MRNGFIVALLLATIAGVANEAKEQAVSKRAITVQLKAPSPLWSVAISHVYETDAALVVLANLTKKDGMGAMMITTIKDAVKLEVSERPVKRYLTGKTWNWGMKRMA